ncbi:hypothetical protein [uncultured Pedobacter sp.]|uniref:Crp/Fnr family transcriptional regulator n=1 Tax=uncultured Pedobacter sp. TaxID=246139 RepID=UPI0025F41CE7|nr:hypothetical protein [uncultured Pedobacter sp.]
MNDLSVKNENIMNYNQFMALTRMLAQLELIHPISETLFTEIYKHAKFNAVANNKHISSPLNVEKRIIYIEAGICQISKKVESKQITIRLIDRGSFIAYEVMSNEPGYVKAIGPVEFISFPASILERLASTDTSAKVILFTLMQRELTELKLSSITIAIKPTRRRLDYFRSTQPVFEESIPLKYIASYLGITLETLIRIRKSPA